MEQSGNIWLLDYGAGNVRSIINAFAKIGQSVSLVKAAEDITNAPVSSVYNLAHYDRFLYFLVLGLLVLAWKLWNRKDS